MQCCGMCDVCEENAAHTTTTTQGAECRTNTQRPTCSVWVAPRVQSTLFASIWICELVRLCVSFVDSVSRVETAEATQHLSDIQAKELPLYYSCTKRQIRPGLPAVAAVH